MKSPLWVRMIDQEGNIFDRRISGERIYDVGLGNIDGDTRVIPAGSETYFIGPDELVYPMPLCDAVRLGAAALDRLVSQ